MYPLSIIEKYYQEELNFSKILYSKFPKNGKKNAGIFFVISLILFSAPIFIKITLNEIGIVFEIILLTAIACGIFLLKCLEKNQSKFSYEVFSTHFKIEPMKYETNHDLFDRFCSYKILKFSAEKLKMQPSDLVTLGNYCLTHEVKNRPLLTNLSAIISLTGFVASIFVGDKGDFTEDQADAGYFTVYLLIFLISLSTWWLFKNIVDSFINERNRRLSKLGRLLVSTQFTFYRESDFKVIVSEMEKNAKITTV